MRKLYFCTFRITRAQLCIFLQVMQFWLKTFLVIFKHCVQPPPTQQKLDVDKFFWNYLNNFFMAIYFSVFGNFFYDDPGFQMSIIQRIEPVYFKTCMHQSVSNLLEHEKKRLAKFLLIYSRSDPIFGYCYFNRVASGQTK